MPSFGRAPDRFFVWSLKQLSKSKDSYQRDLKSSSRPRFLFCLHLIDAPSLPLRRHHLRHSKKYPNFFGSVKEGVRSMIYWNLKYWALIFLTNLFCLPSVEFVFQSGKADRHSQTLDDKKHRQWHFNMKGGFLVPGTRFIIGKVSSGFVSIFLMGRHQLKLTGRGFKTPVSIPPDEFKLGIGYVSNASFKSFLLTNKVIPRPVSWKIYQDWEWEFLL